MPQNDVVTKRITRWLFCFGFLYQVPVVKERNVLFGIHCVIINLSKIC